MGHPKIAERPAGARVQNPHEKLAEYVREFTSRRIKFRPRTRAILVFIGAAAVIIGWLTPWYTSMVWVNAGAAMSAALHNGYQVTNPSGFGGNLIAQGLTPLIWQFNGTALTSGPPALASIAFTKHDFECWIGLAVLALLAMWTYEQPGIPGASVVRERIHKYIESGKVILLVYVLFRSIWKGIDLGTLATVNQHALSALTSDFTANGIPASAAHDFGTTFSVGLILLVVGLIFAALGVLSGDKAPKLGPDGYPVAVPKVRLKTLNVALIAGIVILAMYAVFQG